MSKKATAGEWRWQMPLLTREGQKTFWDRQAPDYGSADMTDNKGEEILVRSLSSEVSARNEPLEDIVTLGGAVGCRDPLIVTDVLRKPPARIYFNDLSDKMTRAAAAGALASYGSETKLHILPGHIHEIAHKIPPMPRRVIIGVYRAPALLKAFPQEDYAVPGLDVYLNDTKILGDTFIFEPMFINAEGIYTETGIRTMLTTTTAGSNLEKVRSILDHSIRFGIANVIRVVGRHEGRKGYFLSHWFTEEGILALVRPGFSGNRMSHASLQRCAKGFVLCIDPVQTPRGVVTILNNVVGNIIPDEQQATLCAIDQLSA